MTNIIIFFSQEEILKPWKHGQMPFSLGPGQQLVCFLYFLQKWAWSSMLLTWEVSRYPSKPHTLALITSQIMLWELPKEYSWGRTSNVWWTVLEEISSPFSSSPKIYSVVYDNSQTCKCHYQKNYHICCPLFHITLKPLILTLTRLINLEKPRILSVS